jgi:hypothetical protein
LNIYKQLHPTAAISRNKMRRKKRRALQLADRPRLRQRQISWAKNEELKGELEALRASVERPGGEDDPKKTRLLKARENLL